MRDTFIAKLSEHAELDPNIYLITGDLGFKVLDDFQEKFPKQFLNVGVAEQNMTGIATGLAMSGRTVFTYSIANFVSLRCLEQIRNDALYHEANVNFVCIGGGFSYGSLGMSHHATEDIGILRTFPNLDIVVPCSLWEASQATSALATSAKSSYLRIDKSHVEEDPSDTFTLGKARILRAGTDITIIGAGGILAEALIAAEELEKTRISVRVVSMHTIKPLDTETIFNAATETGGIISLEEHTVAAGLGSAIAETLLEAGVIPKVFHRIGLRDGFSSIVGSQFYLRKRYKMDSTAIIATIKEKLDQK
ncbi:MAG: transketolase C-terminal domain-containing protein [Bdellovibrionota bacterium]